MYKLLTVSIALTISFQTNSSQVNPTRWLNPKINQSISSFHYMTGLNQADFRNAGSPDLTKTFSVTTPGTFTLIQDIPFSGSSGATTPGGNCSVYVNTSNVIVDLGGKTLYQNNATANQNGIEIAQGLHNITIKNGNIIGFKGSGIYCHPSCNNVRFQDITISNCARQGIFLAGNDNNSISNVIIENCLVSKTTGVNGTTQAVGLRTLYCTDVIVNNSLFSDNTGLATTENSIGALVISCSNVVFNNCDASNNQGDTEGYGFLITGSGTGDTGTLYSCSLYECTANNNYGTTQGVGFFIEQANACIFNSCRANYNSGGNNGIGFNLSKCNYNSFENCMAANNKGLANGNSVVYGGRGFKTTEGNGNLFIACQASGNQGGSDSDTAGIGFDLQTESYSIIDNCKVLTNGNSAAYGYGVNITNGTQLVVKNSLIANNRSTTNAQGAGIIDNSQSSTTLVIDCFAYGNEYGTTPNNFQIVYTDPGELNLTATVTAGGMGGIASLKPFQNTTVTP